jgi:hypothetical protein
MPGRGTTAFARITLALGLLSVALHVSVFAWSPCIRSWAQSADRSVLADLQSFICHGGDANAVSPADQKAPSSPEPGKDCLSFLVCQGQAGSWLAPVAWAGLSAPSEFSSAFTGPAPDDAIVVSPVSAPRSRGPPRAV